MNVNFDKLYTELVHSGFYDNIHLKLCNKTKNNNSIKIPNACRNRLNGIKEYKTIAGFEFFVSPCRVGRASKYCLGKINECSIKPTEYKCPLCYTLDTDIVNPCEPLNKIIRKDITENLAIIPNAYPYLEKQFLITTKKHINQIQALNNFDFLSELYEVILSLLSTNDGVIIFNGVCGNSLEHFHCQYTQTKIPLLEILPIDFNGYFTQEYFRAFSLVAKNSREVSQLISTILENGLTYNFLVRKVQNDLQFIFFIRNCIVPNGVENLNFDAPALGGYVVTTDKLNIDSVILEKYLDATNREEDYILISSQFKKGGRQKRNKSLKIKCLSKRKMTHRKK